MEWASLILDALLILVVGAGVWQASRLIVQLRDLRAHRADMERFVRDFNGAITRAEAGIKALRAAARDSGDDLEKMVEKAVMIRDELNFIVESADGVAERLSVAASQALHEQPTSPPQTKTLEPKSAALAERSPVKTMPSSRAEKELLHALKKMN